MATQAPTMKREARDLLNSLTPGARDAKLGDIVVALQEKVAELEARVADLEGAG